VQRLNLHGRLQYHDMLISSMTEVSSGVEYSIALDHASDNANSMQIRSCDYWRAGGLTQKFATFAIGTRPRINTQKVECLAWFSE